MEKFKVGDRVKHDFYGLGIIKKINIHLVITNTQIYLKEKTL